ncbi:MAG: CAP domain-containing protein [Weeksellaceae bacterium]|nr:CAP domain-containing protein [Weeksellaceae bacterium]
MNSSLTAQYTTQTPIKFILSVFLAIFMASNLSAQVTHSSEDFEDLVEEINAVRTAGVTCARQKMKPVSSITWNDKLAQSAAIHAEDMAKKNFFSHIGSDKSNPSHRADRVGYNWQSVSENIAKGPRNNHEVVQGWLKSPDHCRTIMLPQVKEMGVARNGSYWVQVFGLEME